MAEAEDSISAAAAGSLAQDNRDDEVGAEAARVRDSHLGSASDLSRKVYFC